MGLLEKVNLESSTESIFTVRKHDDGLGERLLETIENESQPSSVILMREHKFNRGGRSPSAIVPLIFGGLFIIFPLGIALFALITEPVIGLCFGVFTIPFLFFGGKMVQGPIDMFLNPQPEEEVVQKYWFDRNNKFIVIIEEIYDVEEEEGYAPEIIKAFYLAKTDEIKVLYDPPSDGAMTVSYTHLTLPTNREV